MQYLKVVSTETIQFWVQIYKNNYWKDWWKHESLEESQESIEKMNRAYPDVEYRIVKRQINEEIC